MFLFRLAAVLRVRQRREEIAAAELAAAQRARRRQEELLERLETGRRQERQALERSARRGVVARDLLLYRDYELALGHRLGRERRRLGELDGVCEDRRRHALARSRERKVLERLRERQLKVWRMDEARAQQKRLDELSGRRVALRQEDERRGEDT